MSLLFDENLSPRLARLLEDVFPGAVSVEHVGMRSATDEQVWDYAASNGLAVVTQDRDFVDRSLLLGPPPKVIVIGVGNCSTRQAEALLRWRADQIREFLSDPQLACLEVL